MKFIKNQSFKAVIITKKNIAVFLCCIVLITALCILIAAKDKKNQYSHYTSTDDFYSIILSSQLHNDTNTTPLLKRAAVAVLGFDPSDPKTILDNYSNDIKVKNEYIASEVVFPKPTEAPTPSQTPEQAQSYPIEEVSAAKGMSISNATNISINTNELIASPLTFSLDGNSPEVLIVHTHTTESYTDSGKSKYTAADNDRTTDEQKNITAVGNALCEVLEERGIGVIHDETVHDYPSYNGAYNRSKATVLANLEKYPSIKLVLDLHRDGIVRADGTKVKVACDIDGQKAAQCMFVVGSNISLAHENWLENMKLACKLQNKANELYPNLMRPINLREERFNQQLSTGALIIEVGSNGNTLDEAKYSARLMGNVIASLFGK